MALLRFSLGEAMASLRRGWRSTVFAVLTVAGASLILGLLLWVGQVASVGLERWASVAEISVFISADASDAAVAEVRGALESHAAVEAVDFVGADAARVRLLSDFPEAKSIVESMAASRVPASFEVRLASSQRTGAEVASLIERVRGLSAVEDVRYDSDLVARVSALVAVLKGVGGVVGLLLMLTCAMTVTSVVKLAYESRRDEVEIMYLVGAPAPAIRGPFAAEGLLLALAGASAAVAVLAGGAWLIERRYAEFLMTLLGSAELPRPAWALAPMLVGSVGALGFLSGLIASKGGHGRQSSRDSSKPHLSSDPESTEVPAVVAEPPIVESDR
jgi:cell division transport system permease protein